MPVGARVIGGASQDSIEQWFPAKCAACDEYGRKLTRPDKPLSEFCEICPNSPRGSDKCLFKSWGNERRNARALATLGVNAGGEKQRKVYTCRVPQCGKIVDRKDSLCRSHRTKARNLSRFGNVTLREAVELVIEGQAE